MIVIDTDILTSASAVVRAPTGQVVLLLRAGMLDPADLADLREVLGHVDAWVVEAPVSV